MQVFREDIQILHRLIRCSIWLLKIQTPHQKADFYSIKIGGKKKVGITTLVKENKKQNYFNQTTILNTTEPDKLTYPKRPPYLSIRVSRFSRQFRIAAYQVWSTECTISVVHRFTSVIMILSTVRHLIIQDMDDCLSQQRKTLLDFTPEQTLSVPLEATNLSQLFEVCDQSIISNVEHHSRRLCFILHGERHKLLLNQTANGRSGRCTRKY